MGEWPWKGEWRDEMRLTYKADDCVYRGGISYRCLHDHFSSQNTEPGKGRKWDQVWQRLGLTKPEHIDEKLEAWRQGSGRSAYKKGEYVRHNGRRFVCRENHYSTSIVEPGKGAFWAEYWDLIEEVSISEVSIQTEEVSFPPVDVSKRLSFDKAEPKSQLIFAPDGPASIEEVSLERLQELVESGECKISFELKKPSCKPIRIAQMELIEIEETEEGTYAHFLVLRDMNVDD